MNYETVIPDLNCNYALHADGIVNPGLEYRSKFGKGPFSPGSQTLRAT